MAAANFLPVMTAIYTLEGGFSNDPRDPGGMTNKGVTAREWAAWLRVPLSTITAAQMQALTEVETDPFYRADYWNLIDGDMLPPGIDAMTMHMEVNAGGCAARELQAIVGVNPDGVIGDETLTGVRHYISYAGVGKLIDAQANAQLAHYRSLAGFSIYGNGWTRRVGVIKAFANQLAATGPPAGA